jgi:hypothetical protein
MASSLSHHTRSAIPGAQKGIYVCFATTGFVSNLFVCKIGEDQQLNFRHGSF